MSVTAFLFVAVKAVGQMAAPSRKESNPSMHLVA
jgi:hypothetical protein